MDEELAKALRAIIKVVDNEPPRGQNGNGAFIAIKLIATRALEKADPGIPVYKTGKGETEVFEKGD